MPAWSSHYRRPWHLPRALQPLGPRGARRQRTASVKALRPGPAAQQPAFRAGEIDRAYAALQTFAGRAYRRPITHAEMYRLMRFVEAARNDGESADVGLKLALKA